MPADSISGSINLASIKFNWRGEWASSGVYSKNDVVRYKGRTYFCKTDKLFDQNLAGPEYSPAHVIGSAGDRLESDALIQATWVTPNPAVVSITGASPVNSQLDLAPARSLFSTLTRVGSTTAWDGGAYTAEFGKGSAYISAMAGSLTTIGMFGLNTDPKADNSYASLDYAFYFSEGTLVIYESAAPVGSFGSYSLLDRFTITYDGQMIRYWKNGSLLRQTPASFSPSTPIYGDTSLYSIGGSITNLCFGPGDSNQYWGEHTEGYLYRGGWMPFRQYWPGDVVTLRGDSYVCKNAVFNGHPLYKDGLFTTLDTGTSPDWDCISVGNPAHTENMVEILPNCPPLGWTKFRASEFEPGHQRTYIRARFFTAAGKSYVVGQTDSGRNNGSGVSGESATTYYGTPPISNTFDFWDYRFGRLPGYRGRPPKMIQLVGNDYAACALFDNGEVYHWGYGGHGQNGDGTNNDAPMPKRVGYVHGTHDYRNSGTSAGYLATTRIVKLACRMNDINDATHSIAALDSEGNVWTWGYNGYGQLGHGDYQNRNVPTQINRQHFDGKSIVDIWSNGGNAYVSFVAIDTEGTMWAWGYNGYGQLGNGNTRNEPRPVAIKYNWNRYGGIKKIQLYAKNSTGAVAVLTNDGTLHGVGRQSYNEIAGQGTHFLGYVTQYRPYRNILEGHARRLGDLAYRHVGTNINIANNADDFWIIGSVAGDDAGIVLKEKDTGILYGWGYNWNNWLMQTAATWDFQDNAGVDYYRSYFPHIMALNAPDLTFVGRCGSAGYRTVYFITESGKVYSSGGNVNGEAGWGWDGASGTTNNLIAGMLEYGALATDEASGQRTYFGMRQTERVGMLGGCGSNNAGGLHGTMIVTQSGNLMYIGSHDTYAKAGHNRWGVYSTATGTGGSGKSTYTYTYYVARSGLANFQSPSKVIF